MDYKNFYYRFLLSSIFIAVYALISYINSHLIIYLVLLIYLLIFLEIIFNFNNHKILMLLYVFISLVFFLNINFDNNFLFKFNLFVIIVISFDIFSYIIGKILGRTHIFSISPKKTLEGLIGGIIFSYSFALTYVYYVNLNFSLILIFFITICISSAFIGDIIESFFKRKNNLKNSSNYIPGHGGVFDRFDSFLFSIIFYSISNHLIV